MAAWILGNPCNNHEQTVRGGLANRIISRFAKKIAISWTESLNYFPKEKCVLTGNPVRLEILRLKKKRTSLPVVFVTGGNQGAHSINEAVLEVIEPLLERYVVIHQTGASEKYKDYEMLIARVSQLPPKLRNRYRGAKWLNSSEQAEAYSLASIVVGRSGANTVSEIAALALPALFIPLPWAGGKEQEKNAQVLASIGAAVVLPQERLTPKRLLAGVNSILDDVDRYKKAAKGAKKLINTNAAEVFVDEALKLVQKKK
jgi:UDP-N-acetylglucosamine--N-acetylmuramyl-(pentapeptide) pyrophosphoryl-undecaprenol N-acetylglucosamine transferase